ncbi:MAG TPA: AcaB family transcriptional regulator, partial [Cellvibrionaceae bacterium]|nr:AcaB family transcriptional regulator [Cellvibrionaceae bacterium]
ADLYLIRVVTAFDQASTFLPATTSVIRELLSDMDGFEIDVSESDKPVTVEMQFLTPWAWQGASLLRQYDELIRMCLTARHLGLLTQDEWQQTVREVGNAIRHLFKVPDDYLFTGLRRFRMGGRIKRARSMYAKRGMVMPTLPPEVLNLTRRSRYAPPIKPYIEADKKSRLKAFQRKQVAAGTGASEEGVAGDAVGLGTLEQDLPLTDFASEVADKVVDGMAQQSAARVTGVGGQEVKAARPEILNFTLGTMATGTQKPVTR